ncbi:MAG: hypothetical protein DMF69_08365 [Acidobacteria bacterium]|nr:MAG: hypothetical protein DMF69_08365 [Acidobacteriota bacterium]
MGRYIVILVSLVLGLLLLSTTGVTAQQSDYTGRYVFKNYQKGKGGYVNSLEITPAANGQLHLNFELTYLYMAGKAETFHEGSGEGDGQLRGKTLTATLSDGAGGSCRVTLTFNETLLAGQYSINVKSSNCAINVVPDGLYTRILEAKNPPRTGAARTSLQPEVCPDPKSPCKTPAKSFAPYELSFRLPSKLTRGKTYESLPFYAVILKTYTEESCDADDHTASIERERLKIQTEYPYNKVFASYSCPNLDAVDYSFPGKLDSTGERVLIMTFIAVYAGKTQAQANEFLGYVRTVYPKASLKQMKASYEILDQ